MLTEEEAILFDIAFALRHKAGVKLKDDIATKIAAKRIADHLRLCGWRLTRKPLVPPHTTTASQ